MEKKRERRLYDCHAVWCVVIKYLCVLQECRLAEGQLKRQKRNQISEMYAFCSRRHQRSILAREKNRHS